MRSGGKLWTQTKELTALSDWKGSRRNWYLFEEVSTDMIVEKRNCRGNLFLSMLIQKTQEGCVRIESLLYLWNSTKTDSFLLAIIEWLNRMKKS